MGYLGPLFGVYPLPPVPNLLPVYAIVQAPHLFHPIACAPKHPMLPGSSSMTPFRGRTILPRVHTPCLHAFFAFALATWILQTIPLNHFQQNLLTVFQTSSEGGSWPNHDFVGDSHRRRQLCTP